MEMGTCCAFSARLRAVTMTVSSPVTDAVCVLDCADTGTAPAPSHKAETAPLAKRCPYRIPLPSKLAFMGRSCNRTDVRKEVRARLSNVKSPHNKGSYARASG